MKQALANQPPRQITVVRTDRVGDLILSTPFLRTLREGFPGAAITAMVDPYCRDVLALSGLVDTIIDTESGAAPHGSCDLAISLAPRTSSLRWVYGTGAPRRLGYVYRGRPLVELAARFLLTHRELVTIDPPHNVPHEVEQLDRLGRRLGLPSSLEKPLYIRPLVAKRTGVLLFHLGDRWFVNGWSMGDVETLLSGLSELGTVEITAGPREAKLLAQRGLRNSGWNLHSDLSFDAWASLVGSAEVLLSPDTGAIHLAAAMQTPVVVAYEEATFEHCSRQWTPWKVPFRALLKSTPEKSIPELLAAVEELICHSRNCAPQNPLGS